MVDALHAPFEYRVIGLGIVAMVGAGAPFLLAVAHGAMVIILPVEGGELCPSLLSSLATLARTMAILPVTVLIWKLPRR